MWVHNDDNTHNQFCLFSKSQPLSDIVRYSVFFNRLKGSDNSIPCIWQLLFLSPMLEHLSKEPHLIAVLCLICVENGHIDL